MRPRIELLDAALIDRVLDEAFALLMEPGIKVKLAEARELLATAGATVDDDTEVVRIPESIVRDALTTVPSSFYLYNRHGEPTVFYGDDAVHFDPGSSGVNVLDPETLEHRPSMTPDLARLVKVTEMLPQYDAQSTAVICGDMPKGIGDLWRLYVVLMLSNKPIVTGAFEAANAHVMFDMLALFAGGRDALAEKPQAVFDVCPNPPLIWGEFGAQNLIDLARARIPAEIVSMPLAGAVSPVTLLGSVVQHTAELLSGLALHQLAGAGSPLVWGGAPAIMDMRQGTTPMGAIETAMIDVSYAQIGKSLNMPTHTYLGASDAKLVDAQAGMESGMSALIGALGGVNMISGAGMLDFLACQSAEKLVVDAEAIAMVQHLLNGVQVRTDTLATEMYTDFAFKGEFLKMQITRDLFATEHHLPSPVIDRNSVRDWQAGQRSDTFSRAQDRVAALLSDYERPQMDADTERELRDIVARAAASEGWEGELPPVE